MPRPASLAALAEETSALPNVMALALKRAEDDNGFIVRFLELLDQQAPVKVTFPAAEVSEANKTDVVERKVKALDHLVSQRYDGVYARKRAEAADGWKGTRVDVPYAETFVPMIPEVHRYLPVMASTLEANKGWSGRIERLSDIRACQVPYQGKKLV